MNPTDETKLSVATRPRSVQLCDPQPEAVVADLTAQTRLEIALGVTEPLPWPQSIGDERALARRREIQSARTPCESAS